MVIQETYLRAVLALSAATCFTRQRPPSVRIGGMLFVVYKRCIEEGGEAYLYEEEGQRDIP